MGKKIIFQKGDIIGTNKLIKQDLSKEREYWFVECLLCHKIRSVRKDHLGNKCKECAIKDRKKYSHIQDDLTGRVFGNWTVLYKADAPNFWHCKCKCGHEKDVFRGSLISGNSKSCGCLGRSYKEIEIKDLLQKYQIPYITEYTNKDLKTPKGGQCRFDFAILNKNQDIICLIEYDGKQHFEYKNTWVKTSEELEYRQQLDHFKDEYAKQINIPLIRLNKNSNLEESIKNIKNLNFTNILKYPLTISNNQKNNLSKQEILDIVTDLKESSLTISQIAEKFNVSKDVIYRINNGKSYLNLFNNKSYPIRYHKIQCINTQEVFDSIKEAAQWCDIAGTNITRCAKGSRPTAGKHPITKEKLKWRYINNEI